MSHIPATRQSSSWDLSQPTISVSDWETEWLHRPRRQPRPFLKWAGGKRRLVHRLLGLLGPLPEDSTYFEPFLGSGALFFALGPAKAVLSDANYSLIESYRLVKTRSSELCAFLATLPSRPTRDQYYTIRERFNATIAERGSLTEEQKLALGSMFIWLNHTCFNGLFRVNRSGLFNVPIGSHPTPYIFDRQTIRLAGNALRASKAEILCSDYRKVVSGARAGDRVYLDPPYDSGEGESFTDYTPSGFSSVDQKELAQSVNDLVSRGVRVLVSNSDSATIRRLYRKYQIHTISAPRSISRESAGRHPVKELVVVA